MKKKTTTSLFVFDRPYKVFDNSGQSTTVYGIVASGPFSLEDLFLSVRLHLREAITNTEWHNTQSVYTQCWVKMHCNDSTNRYLSFDDQIYSPYRGSHPCEFERDFLKNCNMDDFLKIQVSPITRVLLFDSFTISRNQLWLTNKKAFQEILRKVIGCEWLSLN
jgi:hypothetical protein